VKTLTLAQHVAVTYDNLSTGHQWAVRWGPFVQGDLADHRRLVQTMNEYAIDAVIHFAASAYVGDSIRQPAEYFQNNTVNSLTLLNAMREAQTRRIIFSSSCATYGIPRRLPISERHPQNPINPYGESKRFVERALQWYELAYGLQWVALRYFNAAGADPDGELGEAHDPETHLIPRVIQAALGKAPPVEVKGSDYPTPDGTAVRDYVHVMDLADAHIRALEYLLNGGASMAINLGTGRGYSVRDVIHVVERVSGYPVPFYAAGRRDGDPTSLVAETTLGHRVLGWTPRHSDLDEIVRTAWNWHASPRRC
jgi:UDP-glucose-4-epimerase GalE